MTQSDAASDSDDDPAESNEPDDKTPPAPPWLGLAIAAASIAVTPALLGFALLGAVPDQGPLREQWSFLFHAWIEWQFSALALWLAIGRGDLWLRAAAVGVAGILLKFGVGLGLRHAESRSSPFPSATRLVWVEREWVLVFLAVALLLGWMRWTGRARLIGPGEPAPRNLLRAGTFTLAQWMLAVGLFGVALGFLPRLSVWGWHATYAISVAAITFAATWATLGLGRTENRLAIVFVSAIVLGPCLALIQIMTFNAGVSDPGKMRITLDIVLEFAFRYGVGTRLLVEVALSAAALGVFRYFGYRFVWLDRSAAKRLPASAASLPDGGS